MLYFAKKFPERVAGLVLIDSSSPEQINWFPAVYPVRSQSRSWQRITSIPRIPQNYPQGLQELGFHLMNTRKARRTLRFESMNFEISAQQVSAMGELPQIPLAVLSRGERAWPDTPQGERNETNWVRLQNNLARMAAGSRHVMASFSGHFIHLDQPFLVKEAIDAIAEKYQYQCQQRIQYANVPVYAQIKNEVKYMTNMISLAHTDAGLSKAGECL
jgi:pimeloyl-ACP methyl ester carboxylesterase